MAAPLNCQHCGAPPLGNESRFCTYCGSELSFPESEVAAVPTPAETLEARFAALRAYPTFDELCAHKPSTAGAAMGLYGQVIGGGIFTVVALGMTFFFAAVGGPIAFVPGLMFIFGLWITFSGMRSASGFSAAPLLSRPATVLGERVKVSGGGKNSSARTTYFATIQLEDGGRQEYQVLEAVASKVVSGDMGIAYLKSNYVVDFIVVPV